MAEGHIPVVAVAEGRIPAVVVAAEARNSAAADSRVEAAEVPVSRLVPRDRPGEQMRTIRSKGISFPGLQRRRVFRRCGRNSDWGTGQT